MFVGCCYSSNLESEKENLMDKLVFEESAEAMKSMLNCQYFFRF